MPGILFDPDQGKVLFDPDRGKVLFETPPPPPVCDSVFSQKFKCGFAEFGTPSSPPKFYLEYDYTQSGHWSGTGALGYAPDNCAYTNISVSLLRNVHQVYDRSTCIESTTSDVSNSEAHAHSSPPSVRDYDCVDAADLRCWTDLTDGFSPIPRVCGIPATCTPGTTPNHRWTHCSVSESCDNGNGCSQGSGGTLNTDETLTNEYTTAQLIEDVLAGFPSYPETWTGTCFAQRFLREDEAYFNAVKFKYKFQFDTPPIAGRKLCWNEHFQPYPSGTPSDTARLFEFDGTVTETDVYEVLAPSSNGTITITGILWC